MNRVPLVLVLVFFIALGATAQTTNGLSDAEVQGQQLVQEILSQRPAENTVSKGTIQILGQGGHRSEVPFVCKVFVSVTVADTNIIIPNWQTFYEATLTNQVECLGVTHTVTLTNTYSYSTNASHDVPVIGDVPIIGQLFGNNGISGPALMSPFAGSDFWICDLGLEFLHWPQQKILGHEERRTRQCMVLESTNPNPSAGYSRVVSWIDDESLAPVHAEAYDANGKLLKIFDPKKVKKVNGQWQLEDMEIQNVQTKSRTWIKFDLSGKS